MFDSVGWGELLVIALAALFIFGPERLPTLAKDAAAGLKRVRAAITDVRGHVDESFGGELGELRDLDLRRYHPRTFIREQLFGDEDEAPLRAGGGSGATASQMWEGAPNGDGGRVRNAQTPPPFDPDAT